MESDIQRLEAKLDKLTEAVMRLVVLEERQAQQSNEIHRLEGKFIALENKTSDVRKDLDMWVNRGIGIVALISAIFALYKLFV